MRTINFNDVVEGMYSDIMEETYLHLAANNFNWESDMPLNDLEKSELISEMIVYFEEKEEFEKCEDLIKMKTL
jgi:hypothetical protein